MQGQVKPTPLFNSGCLQKRQKAAIGMSATFINSFPVNLCGFPTLKDSYSVFERSEI